MLHNLLHNALRHTPPGGEIIAKVEKVGNALVFAVKDTGEEIHKDYLSRVFDRFYRIDPARSRDTGGTGLGLAVVRALVEAHQGTVSAISEGIGKGSMFIVQIPVIP